MTRHWLLLQRKWHHSQCLTQDAKVAASSSSLPTDKHVRTADLCTVVIDLQLVEKYILWIIKMNQIVLFTSHTNNISSLSCFVRIGYCMFVMLSSEWMKKWDRRVQGGNKSFSPEFLLVFCRPNRFSLRYFWHCSDTPEAIFTKYLM